MIKPMKCRANLFDAFRRDRLAGLWLAAILLFIPYVQPMSEALAAGKPFAGEICSTFGTSGKAAVPAMADDCAACIAGSHAPQLAAVPADVARTIAPPFSLANPAYTGHEPPLPQRPKRWLAPPGQGPPSVI